MPKRHLFTTFFLFLLLTFGAQSRSPKVDYVLDIQTQVNQAYKLGYVDASPIQMDRIEKKLVQARLAQNKRRKKDLARLVKELRADLKLVKKRYEVNKKQMQLSELQQKNLESKKLLDELKAQL